ncbi:MAG: serine/threonine protein kinase, partial [Acidobacteriota bacterium]|nr:serine/threonine protein kinase [Acidobacteriota bacterium]
MKSCPTCKTTYPGRFSVCPQDGAALVESSEWSVGTVIRGKYRILGKLGQGGMGSVYKASHVVFDELRALKVINPELTSDDHFLKRFKQEAIIARRLDHPNAVRVDDIDESESGLPFIVMEYIEGRSLKDLIEKEAPLPTGRACAIVRQVAAALGAAHGLGMVHRDVKPANVMVVNTPRGEQAKVLDFGIAKAKEARSADSSGMTLTGTGIVTGTPQYMSPEQALGKRSDQLDGRSDLYSLGVMMYQMLTGDLPFKADTTMQLLLAHINTPPRPLLEARPESGISPALARVVMRCLEKDPGRRPSSGAELIAEIDDAEAASAVGEQAEPSMTATRLASPPAGLYSPPKVVKPPPPFAAPASPQIGADEASPPAKKTGFKGILAAVIAAIVVIGVIVMAWGVHRFRAPAHSLAPAAAQAPLQTAQSPATAPSGNLQQASPPNPAETAETTAPPAASTTSEITGTAATKQSQNRESASASKKSSAPPRALTQPAQKQAAPAQPAAVLPPKV